MASKLLPLSKLHKILFTTPKHHTISRSAYSSSSSSNQESQDDDAMTQGVDTQGETHDDPKPEHKDNITPTKEDDHYIRPKTTPSNPSSSKLQTPGVNTPIDPHVQQKRTLATKPKDELTCAGLDGSPWPEEESASREEQEEEDKEYFKEHKASPLSNMEMGDTRKPLEKVVQATAGGYFGDEKVMTWLPEQIDTAEESLLRATKMFRAAAERGVPEWPHSRRLRELRGEDW
ncbi:hypothetical protein Hdeb2414_s0007g00225981 [Helianthus debilis subsp. tardiflorus]